GGGAMLVEFPSQAGEFLGEGLGCLGWIGWGNESSRRESLSCPERSVKPDAKLPGHLERGQGVGVVAFVLVGRPVAQGADVVKEIANFQRDYVIKPQAPEKIGLRFLRVPKQAGFRRDQLSQRLAVLAEFDETGNRVILKVTLSERTKTHELHIVHSKEREICRLQLLSHARGALAHDNT